MANMTSRENSVLDVSRPCIYSIIAQVIIEMHVLLLVENYVISSYNHPMRGDYNTETLIFQNGHRVKP